MSENRISRHGKQLLIDGDHLADCASERAAETMQIALEKSAHSEGFEFFEGYTDGLKPDTPEPSENRSWRYRHSFEIGRAELSGHPIPAAISRERAAEAEAKDRGA